MPERPFARGAARLVAVVLALALAGCAGQRTPQVSVAGPYYADPPGSREKLEADLQAARAQLAAHPEDPEAIVWVGRRLGYLWRMREAIAVYTEGIRQHPEYAPLYRHRGHRYISVRDFPGAIADLEKAALLIQGQPDMIEQDGQPNAANTPLTTLAFNVWYHLGLARFLSGDYEGALAAYRECAEHANGHDDNRVAVSYWMTLTLWRLGRDEQVAEALEPITSDMRILENQAYHRLLLLYKGVLTSAEAHPGAGASAQDTATLLFGLANWRMRLCDVAGATFCLWLAQAGTDTWPAFGHIAAEVDRGRMGAALSGSPGR